MHMIVSGCFFASSQFGRQANAPLPGIGIVLMPSMWDMVFKTLRFKPIQNDT